MPPNQRVFLEWWPTTQSLDLVEGSIENVAEAAYAVFSDIAKFVGDEFSAVWQRFEQLDMAFSSVPYFDNVGSYLLVLPTRSKWSVMWNNNFLCNGNDRFCLALTSQHALTTIHWSSHDDRTTFQPGTMFHLRRKSVGGLLERRVQSAQTDRRWDFFEQGYPLPEEDLDGYQAKKKRDRINEQRIIELLARLGAFPWDEAFYALPEQRVFSLSRPLPKNAVQRMRNEVLIQQP